MGEFSIKYFFILIAILILNISEFEVKSQLKADISKYENVFNINEKNADYKFAIKNRNLIKNIFGGIFLFYKSFISSQDMARCSFTPSCSLYTMRAIQKQGFFIGVINGLDRLTRCNPLSPELYEIDPNTKLFIDPVY